MSKIEYQTEGRVQVDSEDSCVNGCAFTWQKTGATARLHSGSVTIALSRGQLLQIAELAPAIAADLREAT